MRTIEDILSLFPGTTESDWKKHENGGGWVQITANVGATCRIEGIVSGNAWVSGNAQVFGDAWGISPLQIQGSVHFATNCKFGHISIGCEVHTFAEWKTNFRSIGKKHGYTEAQIEEYGAIIDLFCKIGK